MGVVSNRNQLCCRSICCCDTGYEPQIMYHPKMRAQPLEMPSRHKSKILIADPQGYESDDDSVVEIEPPKLKKEVIDLTEEHEAPRLHMDEDEEDRKPSKPKSTKKQKVKAEIWSELLGLPPGSTKQEETDEYKAVDYLEDIYDDYVPKIPGVDEKVKQAEARERYGRDPDAQAVVERDQTFGDVDAKTAQSFAAETEREKRKRPKEDSGSDTKKKQKPNVPSNWRKLKRKKSIHPMKTRRKLGKGTNFG